MPGLKLVLPTSFTDTTLPILRDDAMLVPGSLFLFDAAHPLNPMASGIPSSGATVPNLAATLARTTIGGTADLSGTIHFAGISTAGTSKGKLERTPKGGIHAVLSQSVALAAGDGLAIEAPSAVKSFILANPSHSYFFSVWDRLTRVSLATAMRTVDLSGGSTVATHHLGYISGSSSSGANGGTGRAAGAGFNGIGNAMKNGYGTAPSLTTLNTASARFGSAGSYNYNTAVNATGSNATSHPSGVIYRFVIEDLTVSGRSYAQADAADYEAWNTAFGVGGRYAGDTIPTAPATIP